MQVTRSNEIRRPGVRLHSKACAAMGLEAERATPKRLKFQYQEHACMPWEQATPGSPVNLQGSAQRRGPAQARVHTFLEGQAHHADGAQPSQFCPGPLCWGPPVRSSGM